MFFDCPFWNHLAKLLHELLGPHPLQKKRILYGHSTLDTTLQHLLVLAKSYLATNSTHRHTPDYRRMFRTRLQYRLYKEMHYSLWANGMDTFRGCWLHGNILGKIHLGKIILSDKISSPPYVISDCLSDAVYNHQIL
jgi:hypothetical protein